MSNFTVTYVDGQARHPRGHLPLPARKRVEHDKLAPFPMIEDAFKIEGKAGTVTADVVDDGLGEVYVVKTNPQCEDRALANIERLEFPAYLPTGVRWRAYRRKDRMMRVRRKTILMPGYIFVRLPDVGSPLRRVRECEGVRDFVFENGRPGIVKRTDAGQIFANQLDGRFDETIPAGMHWVRPGAEVIIEAGTLKSFSGTVKNVDMDSLRATVEALMLGRPVEVHLPFDEIRERDYL